MEITNPDTFLVRAGFVLFMLALLTGFLIPLLLNHKMALAAHVTGIMNALVLIALGLAWGGSSLLAHCKLISRGAPFFTAHTLTGLLPALPPPGERVA